MPTSSNPASGTQQEPETIPVGDDWDGVIDNLRKLAASGLTPESESALNQMIVTFQGHTHDGLPGPKRVPKPIPSRPPRI